MKKIISPVVVGLLLLAPLACQRTFQGPPSAPDPAPTPTPTATATTVCGFSLISLGTVDLHAGPAVIRNLADWQTFCGYPGAILPLTPVPTPPIPAPPVDFSRQMLILIITPVCASSTLRVTGVCEGPDQITVSADNVQACVNCNVASPWGAATALVVPQSSLPVAWNTTQVTCQMGILPTPTATP